MREDYIYGKSNTRGVQLDTKTIFLFDCIASKMLGFCTNSTAYFNLLLKSLWLCSTNRTKWILL